MAMDERLFVGLDAGTFQPKAPPCDPGQLLWGGKASKKPRSPTMLR